MNRRLFTIILIILQIGVLSSFIIRYEILKRTGTTVYIPLRGYDPTDIFRGDYVNLAYELPFTGNISSMRGYYLVPKFENNTVVGMDKLLEKKPSSGIYFHIQNGWPNEIEEYIVDIGSGKTLNYRSTYCRSDLSVGDDIVYPIWSILGDTSITSLEKMRNGTDQEIDNKTDKYGKIISKSSCGGTYRFQVAKADRWFVPEGTGLDIEKEILKGDMYAEWKVAENGAIIVTNILTKENLPK